MIPSEKISNIKKVKMKKRSINEKDTDILTSTKKKIKKKNSIFNEMMNAAIQLKQYMDRDTFLQSCKCTEIKSCSYYLNSKTDVSTDDNNDIIVQPINIKDFCFNYCRECSQKDSSKLFCRFIGWKILKIDTNFVLTEHGFLEEKGATDDDLKTWKTNEDIQLVEQSDIINHKLKIFSLIDDSFYKLIENEIKLRETYESVLWKRQIKHEREICDQCSTSIFNGHFVCLDCGFSVCADCRAYRLRGLNLNPEAINNKDLDNMSWHFCYKMVSNQIERSKQNHIPTNLSYVQYIPRHVLNTILIDYNRIKKSISNDFKEQKNVSGIDSNVSYLEIDCKEGKEEEETMFKLFDAQWLNKKPIVVRNLKIDENLWSPSSFSQDFGHLTVDLINCQNNCVIPNQKMETFWKGFENFDERIRELKTGKPLMLKLKDWPTSNDFKEILPNYFKDLMKNLPIKKYTDRNGPLNLASFVPEVFSKPDLGPKLYIAYSSADLPKSGTTNLHLDISDAVNVLMYVGDSMYSQSDHIPDNETKNNKKKIFKDIRQLIEESNCSKSSLKRFNNGEKPGAIWHIFLPKHADDIRTFLTLLQDHKGIRIKNENDPIHDQTYYINDKMLKRLKEEYNIEPFTIIQFLGDAIFIPSGAPHQVRNLNSCIKVAGDFVTPQGVDECLRITDQFRKLSFKHSNREDKLQIKNIVYHSMKECISYLKTSC